MNFPCIAVIPPASGARNALLVLLIAAALAPLVPEEYSWGFRYFSLLPSTAQVVLFLLFLLALSSSPLVARLPLTSARPRGTADLVLVGGSVIAASGAAFYLLSSERIYGDGASTMRLLFEGQQFNWKQPLDRFLTAQVYAFGRRCCDWSPREAIAWVSRCAGIAWTIGALGVGRVLSRRPADRWIVTALLMSSGMMQLFFGNIENYSLLAAGNLLYLWAGIAFLRGQTSFFVPCFVLSLTCWTHLSAVWISPTLILLYFYKVNGGLLSLRRPSRRDEAQSSARRQAELGLLGLIIPTAVTLCIGLATVGSLYGLSLENFGGSDGKLFVPLFSTSTRFEKFTLFSIEHFAAVLNELLLVAPVPLLVAASYLLLTGKESRIWSGELCFVGMNALGYLAFVFLFNPDMSIYSIGLLNEWDLFSAPAAPLCLLAGVLLLQWEREERSRVYVGLLAAVAATILTFAWILFNARIQL